MGKDTKISWCDHTFNPWWGCTKVSPGCANCYAEAVDQRFLGGHWGIGKDRRRTSVKNWREPLKWNREADGGVCVDCGQPCYRALDCACGQLGAIGELRRARVFCASMADWLDHEVPVEWLSDFLLVIERTPHLDWLLLTKRPELWRERLRAAFNDGVRNQLDGCLMVGGWLNGTPPANVWLGTTVEDRQRKSRIDHLREIPAALRFLSVEPQLEHLGDVDLTGIGWVICGGESGDKARPFDLAWARSVRDQCAVAGVPFFMKQLGSNPHERGRVLRDSARRDAHDFIWDRAGANPAEWPADLQVQQFPKVGGAS